MWSQASCSSCSSWETMMNVPLEALRKEPSHRIAALSRWLVGSSWLQQKWQSTHELRAKIAHKCRLGVIQQIRVRRCNKWEFLTIIWTSHSHSQGINEAGPNTVFMALISQTTPMTWQSYHSNRQCSAITSLNLCSWRQVCPPYPALCPPCSACSMMCWSSGFSP
jgi:hypothetical protein